MEHVNLPAVAVAALTSFMLGGLWYSPLMLLKSWERESGQAARTNDNGRHPAMVFGLAYVLAFLAALFFTYILGPQPGLSKSITTRSFKLWMINAGYHGAQFLLFGLIFGLWP